MTTWQHRHAIRAIPIPTASSLPEDLARLSITMLVPIVVSMLLHSCVRTKACKDESIDARCTHENGGTGVSGLSGESGTGGTSGSAGKSGGDSGGSGSGGTGGGIG